jgi:hypothetical protein
MMLGMSLAAFTLAHVIISLIGIAAGLVCAAHMIGGRSSSTWTWLFLTSTIVTSVTGFLFPSKFGAPHVIGILSLLLLALAVYALLVTHRSGGTRWRVVYAVSALTALYLNVFVAVVQAFQKIPVLHAYAPNGSEPPFALAQAGVLALSLWVGYHAWARIHSAASI